MAILVTDDVEHASDTCEIRHPVSTVEVEVAGAVRMVAQETTPLICGIPIAEELKITKLAAD